MQTLSIISSIKNFNKHFPIDHFHFKHETRIKRKVIELSLQVITIRPDNKFTMQCYGAVTELRCHVTLFLQNCVSFLSTNNSSIKPRFQKHLKVVFLIVLLLLLLLLLLHRDKAKNGQK